MTIDEEEHEASSCERLAVTQLSLTFPLQKVHLTIAMSLRGIMQAKEKKPDSESNSGSVEFSSQVVEALAKAEAERMMPGASEADRKAKEKDIADRMVSPNHHVSVAQILYSDNLLFILTEFQLPR